MSDQRHIEVGQILHNNPVGFPMPYYAVALMKDIRDYLEIVYWNTQQKHWEAGRDYEPRSEDESHGLLPLPPGIEWRHYYNWQGSPEDADWDQVQAEAPNFSFEGVEIRWYKRFGRAINANVVWDPVKWVTWYNRCTQTISNWERDNCSAFSHYDRIPMPDRNDKVPLV